MSSIRYWDETELGPLCLKIGSGITPRGGGSVYIDKGVALIRSQNVYNNEFDNQGLAYINDDQAEKMNGVIVERGDTFLNITGDSVARCCITPESVLPARVNQHVSIIRPRPDKLDYRFLMYFFVSPYMQSYMLSLAGSGGTRKALTKGMIEKFKIPLPKITIQRGIVAVLSAYDDLIENNIRRIQLLEESARLLYKEWFVHLRFPGHEHVKIKDDVPEGWKKITFGSICLEIKELINPKSIEPDTPYIGLEHIPRKSITLSDWGTAGEVSSTKHKYSAGDILFGKIRSYFHKVGFTLTDGITSSDAIVIRPVNEELWPITLMLTSSDHFVNVSAKTAKEGSKMPRADWHHMQSYSLLLPSTPVLLSFNGSILNITSLLKSLALQNRKLKQARDLLLPRLMNGEIAV
jgi:type I restriction enzyme, S subunit